MSRITKSQATLLELLGSAGELVYIPPSPTNRASGHQGLYTIAGVADRWWQRRTVQPLVEAGRILPAQIREARP